MNETRGDEVVEDSDVYLFILPTIVTFGLGGNIISLVTIFHSRLRHVSANMYLIVLTAADSVFLAGILMICFKVDFISFEYCVGLEYVLMVASYISSWSTAALTIERYLAIAHPLKHVRYGHVDRSKMMIYWLPIPFILHLFQFVNLVPVNDEHPDARKCMLRAADYQVLSEFIDMLLCFGLPCLVVVILNLMVAGKVKKQSKFMGGGEQRDSRRQGGSSQNGGLTRILWVVPMVFVILNTPFYIVRLFEVFSTHIFGSDESVEDYTDFGKTLYNSAHYLYYLNFASDVIVYAFSSANFRKTAVIAWRRIICPGYERNKMVKSSTANVVSRSTRDTTVETQLITTKEPQRSYSARAPPKPARDWSKLDGMDTSLMLEPRRSTSVRFSTSSCESNNSQL